MLAVPLRHEREKLGTVPLLDQLRGAALHRCPTGVRLEAASPAAAAPASTRPDADVADLAAAADPPQAQVPAEDERPADPGAEPDAERVGVSLRSAETVLAEHADADVVVDDHRHAQLPGQLRSEGEGVEPSGEVGAAGDDPGGAVDGAGCADADRAQPGSARARQRLGHQLADGGGDRRGTAALGRRRTTLTADGEVGVGDDHLELGAPHIDSGEVQRARTIPGAGAVRGGRHAGICRVRGRAAVVGRGRHLRSSYSRSSPGTLATMAAGRRFRPLRPQATMVRR